MGKDVDYKTLKPIYSNSDGVLDPKLFDNYKWMTTNEAAAYLRKSTNAIRTIDKKGIAAVLAEAKANGNILV